MKHVIACVVLAGLFTAAASLRAEEASPPDEAQPAERVSYWNDIRPIFQAHCQGCHQPAKPSGEYVMTRFDALVGGGESGEQAIVPGDPAGSYLMDQITPTDGTAAMPQDKPALNATQIDLITRWIESGAENDMPTSARQKYDQDHPPVYSAAPVLTAIRFSPDGTTLAISGYHEVLLHDVQKALEGEPSLKARLIGMSERIEAVAFSPDGETLAVSGGSPGRLGEVQLWQVDGAKLLYSLPVTYDTCYGISWSPDGKMIGFGCPDNTIRAVNAESGEQVLFNGAHSDWVLDTVFSVKSTHIVSVSRDRSMKLIEIESERFVDNITSITPGALKGGLHTVDRHPTEDHLLIGGSDGVPKIYRMFREKARKIGDDFNLIKKFPEMQGRIFDVQYSQDGSRVVAGSSFNGSGHVHVFTTEDGKRLSELKQIPSAIFAVAFSPDAKFVASGGFSGDVFLHRADSGELVRQFLPMEIQDQQVAQATGTVNSESRQSQ